MEPSVSVLIPTYERAKTLKYVLEGLEKQTYRNFEIIIVLKPGQDETSSLLEAFQKKLRMKVVIQKQGSVAAAYNLGLRAAKGEIIAFLDDDAIPSPDWMETHIKTYERFENVGGVSGIAKSAKIQGNKRIVEIPEEHVYPYKRQQKYYDLPWTNPLRGMSDWLIYFGKDGLIHNRALLDEKETLREPVPSLLYMGANMSVKRKAIEGTWVNENSFLGFAFEQVLSFQIWKRGYSLLFNPKAKVLHVIHRESTGRFYTTPKKAALRDAEFVLTFLSLRSKAKDVSWIAYILGVFKLILARILRAKNYGLTTSVYRVYGLLYGFVIANSYAISGALGGRFSIRNSLERLL